MKKYQLLIEVRFKETGEKKSFFETHDSFIEALKLVYKKINDYNIGNQEYEELCILKSSFNTNENSNEIS
jgi:hypothetical protein